MRYNFTIFSGIRSQDSVKVLVYYYSWKCDLAKDSEETKNVNSWALVKKIKELYKKKFPILVFSGYFFFLALSINFSDFK